ncbi:Lar family restriction alleviation protein [Ochrobactrum sp. RH2CCR150]|uniref:Lar family restriction alleviation protein n=1 Tax=Ochrobactrum sp. RH2CCR150 TaxID=2587044 RepID=UPI0015FE36BD|nr:hypothetical protein [Ochrobactrum sp. RH2CCR150]
MASELKPCPFCVGSNLETYYADIEGWIAHIKCIDCDDMIGPMSEFKYETQEEAYEDASKRWNTRPAPAATDTGLVTIGYAHRGTIGLLMEDAVSKAVIIPKAGGDFRTPVMLVEQAEELLAAKDARINELENRLQYAYQAKYRCNEDANNERATHNRADELLISAVNECHTKDCLIAELEADNAAKDAMILSIISHPIESPEHFRAVEDARLVLGNPEAESSRNEKLIQQVIAIEAKLTEALEALQNLMGCYDTPLSRRRFPLDDFMKEAVHTARTVLDGVLDGKFDTKSVLKTDVEVAFRSGWEKGKNEAALNCEREACEVSGLVDDVAYHLKSRAKSIRDALFKTEGHK